MSKTKDNVALTGTFMLTGGLALAVVSGFAGWETFGIMCSIVMIVGLIIVLFAGSSD